VTAMARAIRGRAHADQQTEECGGEISAEEEFGMFHRERLLQIKSKKSIAHFTFERKCDILSRKYKFSRLRRNFFCLATQ